MLLGLRSRQITVFATCGGGYQSIATHVPSTRTVVVLFVVVCVIRKVSERQTA